MEMTAGERTTSPLSLIRRSSTACIVDTDPMTPTRTLLLSIPVGVAGAVAVVIFQSVVADALGGAIAIGALVAVISSTMRLAGDAGAPDDEPSNRGEKDFSRLRSES
jgi:hypothetical protein